MLGLYKFLTECLILEAAGFSVLVPNDKIGETLFKNYSASRNKLNNEDIEIIQKWFDNIVEQSGGEFRALAHRDNKEKYLKVPRTQNELLKKATETDPSWTYSTSGGNVSIYYKGIKLTQSGSGSFGSSRLETAAHENISSIYFNTDKKYWDELDELISSKFLIDGGTNWVKKWIESFHQQAIVLKQYLNSKKCKNMRAVRIDEVKNIKKIYGALSSDLGWDYTNINDDIKIIEFYNDMMLMQRKWLKKSLGVNAIRREAYDKSDIIIYDTTKVGEILKTKGSISDLDDCIDVKSNMLELFDKGYMINVSLKGLEKPNSSYHIVEFNTSKTLENGIIGEIVSFDVKDIYKQNKKSNISNNLIIDLTTKDNTVLEFYLRSFGKNGNGIIAADVKIKGTATALGKTPSFLWMKFYNDNKHDAELDSVKNINELQQVFTGEKYNELSKKFGWNNKVSNDMIFNFDNSNSATIMVVKMLSALSDLSNKELLNVLNIWAKAAVAEADYAFPFILTKEN